ncbi:hypothetical protein ACHAPY_010286 [Fusarium culmorum]
MATTTVQTTAPAEYTTVQLLTPNGPVSRRVRCGKPRTPTLEEMPIIDLSSIDGDESARKALSTQIKAAAENTGFFYVSNHGIPQDLIEEALQQCKNFFDQSQDDKDRVAFTKAGKFCGYHGVGSTQINNKETKDNKETFSMRYDTRIDPSHDCVDDINSNFDSIDFVWNGTSHLTKFRPVLTEFYQRRLTLARKLIRLFALALELPEDYFDSIITTPGADAVHLHYPGTEETDDIDVGIGSHTDIQCVTLLWQDMSGGLQVLSADDEWLDARPIEGTLVINIGDFLQRLSNNRFKSTVHRVYNRQKASRHAMPFFLGFNPDAVCEVVPTCTDAEHPPLYEPISCGESAQPPRTNNARNNPITYDSGRSSVKFGKPNSDYIMTHRIPPTTKEHGTSIVAPPFHYHIHQDEFFNVQSGMGRFYRGIAKEPFAVLSDEPGGQRKASIKAGRYHRFENASETEDLVVDIHLAPESYENEQRFFRNFFGYLDDCREAGKPPSFFQLMVFLHDGDTPLAVPMPWEWLGKIASRLLLWSAAFWGRFILGYKVTYPEYYEETKSR